MIRPGAVATLAVVVALGVLAWPGRAAAVGPSDPPVVGSPAWAETANVTEHLGATLPMDTGFVDAQGEHRTLGSLFDGIHPVLLVLAYYECPQLCSLVLDGAVRAMRQLEPQGWTVGRQYRVATISFDATERIDQAARKQASVLATLGHRDPATWPFFVGDDASVHALTDGLGFGFLRDPRTGALAHPAVVFVATPDGRIARYLYGIDYPARDLQLALLEASNGKTGSFRDKVMMRCFRYDPTTRRYGLFVARFMEVGGALILVIVVALLVGFARHELRRTAGGVP